MQPVKASKVEGRCRFREPKWDAANERWGLSWSQWQASSQTDPGRGACLGIEPALGDGVEYDIPNMTSDMEFVQQQGC